MNRRDLIKQLTKAGWKIIQGGKHAAATHPDKPGIRLTIPRHTTINKHTAKGILKDAGLLE